MRCGEAGLIWVMRGWEGFSKSGGWSLGEESFANASRSITESRCIGYDQLGVFERRIRYRFLWMSCNYVSGV